MQLLAIPPHELDRAWTVLKPFAEKMARRFPDD